MQKNIKRPKSAKQSKPRSAKPSPDEYQMVVLWSKEDRCFVVTLPAWQNAKTHGQTLAEATQNARDVLTLLIDTATRHGEPIPPAERRFSGNLRVRLPVSLHGRLAYEAEREGVSLNQWIVSRLAG
jgi:predicted RNase H-like HicB family nuclease